MRLSTFNPIGTKATWPLVAVCADSRVGFAAKFGRLECGSRPMDQEQIRSLGYHPRTNAPSLNR